MLDRIVSVITYYTMGIFGLIWLVFCALTKKSMSQFLSFNIYQSMFIAVLLSIFSLLYDIALNFIKIIPVVGILFVKLDIVINQTPIYHTFTLVGFVLTILLTYLAILSLIGKKPHVPWVSDVIKTNFGG